VGGAEQHQVVCGRVCVAGTGLKSTTRALLSTLGGHVDTGVGCRTGLQSKEARKISMKSAHTHANGMHVLTNNSMSSGIPYRDKKSRLTCGCNKGGGQRSESSHDDVATVENNHRKRVKDGMTTRDLLYSLESAQAGDKDANGRK